MRTTTSFPRSPSGRALADLLNNAAKNDPVARAVKATCHRTQLWSYATGRGKPSAETAGKLDKASGGLISATGWADDESEKRPATAA